MNFSHLIKRLFARVAYRRMTSRAQEFAGRARELTRVALAHLDRTEHRPEGVQSDDAVVRRQMVVQVAKAFVGRAFEFVDGLIALNRESDPTVVRPFVVMSRCVLEDAVNVASILFESDAEVRCRKAALFNAYELVQRHAWNNQIEEFRNRNSPAQEWDSTVHDLVSKEEVDRERAKLKTQYEQVRAKVPWADLPETSVAFARRSWDGLDLARRCLEVQERDKAQHIAGPRWLDFYLSSYAPWSCAVHGTGSDECFYGLGSDGTVPSHFRETALVVAATHAIQMCKRVGEITDDDDLVRRADSIPEYNAH